MIRLQRIGLVVVTLLAVANAQHTCKVSGFDSTHNANGISVATGFISEGPFSTGALLYRPIAPTQAMPPVLFSHSDIKTGETRTDLRPMAATLARHGAMVLVLERTVMWGPIDELANRDPHLPDCASQWLLSRDGVDVLHATYVGPRFQQTAKNSRRYPLGFVNLKQPRRGNLYVPLAESEAGSETLLLTTSYGQDRMLKAIEAHWSVEVVQK